jgi:chromosomal replication initiator protein
MTIHDQEDVRLLKIIPVQEIWEKAQVSLAKKLGQPAFEMWIRPTHLSECGSGQAILAVGNEFAGTMISNKYALAIAEAIEEVTKEKVALRVVVNPLALPESYSATIASITSDGGGITGTNSGDNFPSLSGFEQGGYQPDQPQTHAGSHYKVPGGSGGNASPQQGQQMGPGYVPAPNRLPDAVLIARGNLNPKYSFDTFVVGSHNRFSHSAALAVGQRPGQAYNPLFLYGGVGLGKTHIMQAIGHDVLKHNPNASVRYISCEKFTNELINSIRDDKMSDFRKRYRQVDLLLVDDIQFIQGKESTQEEFFHTFNALRDSGRQIVLTSDRPPKAIARLEERLRSRFEWGLIADVQAPDLETRLAILRKKSEADGMRLDDEVLEYIASIFTTNIRELEGALIRAHAYGNLTGERLSVATLAGMLQPTQPLKPKVTLTCDRIIETVAAHYRVEPSELRSAKRSQDLALPRHIAMFLAHDMIQMSFPRIGEAFGHRKHTSALYAHSRIKELVAKDPQLAQSVKQIARQLAD